MAVIQMMRAEELLRPDFKIVKEAREQIAVLATSFQTDYLSGSREKCQLIKMYVKRIDDLIVPLIFELQAKLENENISQVRETVGQLEAALKDPSLSDESYQAALKKQISLLEEMAADTVRTIRKALDATQVDEQLQSLSDINVFDDPTNLSVEKLQDLSNRLARIKALTSKKEQFEKDLATLVNSMDVMRKNDIFDVFLNMVPTDEQIAALAGVAGSVGTGGTSSAANLGAAEITAIKEGVALFKKIFGNVASGFSYAKLQEARLDLEKKIDSLSKEIESERKEYMVIEAQLTDLKRMLDVHEAKSRYIEQIRRLERSFKAVSEELKNDASTADPSYAGITQTFNKFLAYLRLVIRDMRN